MTVEEALDRVWREAARSSQAMVAESIGVSPATITRWKDGNRPRGEGVAKLLAWAEALPPVQTPDVLTAAILATGENVERLAAIRGYAQAVLDQLLDTAKRQQVVVDSLAPWSQAEGRQMALAEQRVEEARASVTQAAAAHAEQAAPAARRATTTRTGG